MTQRTKEGLVVGAPTPDRVVLRIASILLIGDARLGLPPAHRLARLAATAKNRTVPYVTIPEIEFDFELWQPKKTVQEHIKVRHFADVVDALAVGGSEIYVPYKMDY